MVKQLKRDKYSIDLSIILFMLFVVGGLLLYGNNPDVDNSKSNNLAVEHYTVIRDVVLPKLIEGDYFDSFTKFRLIPSFLDQQYSEIQFHWHNEIPQGVTFLDRSCLISMKVPIYILCSQQRFTDGDEVPLSFII